jgi:hypothetical protein
VTQRAGSMLLEHDAEKWKSVFGKDHAPVKHLVKAAPEADEVRKRWIWALREKSSL